MKRCQWGCLRRLDTLELRHSLWRNLSSTRDSTLFVLYISRNARSISFDAKKSLWPFVSRDVYDCRVETLIDSGPAFLIRETDIEMNKCTSSAVDVRVLCSRDRRGECERYELFVPRVASSIVVGCAHLVMIVYLIVTLCWSSLNIRLEVMLCPSVSIRDCSR